jgi:hypothetical protein
MSRDCPEERVFRCRNCDAEGHQSRECPLPKDWSRVKCSVSGCPRKPIESVLTVTIELQQHGSRCEALP